MLTHEETRNLLDQIQKLNFETMALTTGNESAFNKGQLMNELLSNLLSSENQHLINEITNQPFKSLQL